MTDFVFMCASPFNDPNAQPQPLPQVEQVLLQHQSARISTVCGLAEHRGRIERHEEDVLRKPCSVVQASTRYWPTAVVA